MKVIFLDRDGVINKDLERYTTSWDEFEFLPGAKEALAKLVQAGFRIVIISNQAGVAKGLYTKKTLDEITDNMLREIEHAGGKIDSIYYCLHQTSDNCSCRKPKPGLLLKAQKELNIDLAQAFFIGDSRRDVLAGKAAGCKTIIVLSGKSKIEDLDVKPDYIARDLFSAVEKIILKKGVE